MVIFKENRVKKIIRNCIYYLVLMIFITFVFKFFDLSDKSYIDFGYYFLAGAIGLCFSTNKICLEFDDNKEVLRVYYSHILGGGKSHNIAYNHLSFNVRNHDLLAVLLQKSDLMIYDLVGKKIEINNLETIDNSKLLLKKLNEICKT